MKLLNSVQVRPGTGGSYEVGGYRVRFYQGVTPEQYQPVEY